MLPMLQVGSETGPAESEKGLRNFQMKGPANHLLFHP